MSDVITILKKVGAVITNDHFVYTHGRHGDVYINKDILYTHTFEASKVGKLFAEKFKDFDIDLVAGPAYGGIILSQWTAFHLSKLKKKEVLSVYTEKDEHKNHVFKRGYDLLVKGKKVLVVEDNATTGASAKKVADSARNAGGIVVAVCVMVNRDPELVTAESIGAPFYSLSTLEAASYEEKECPMCKKNIPVNTQVGHGKKYLEHKKTNNL